MVGRLIIYGIPLLALAGCVGCEVVLRSRVAPPKNMATLDDFNSWMGNKAMGKADYENSGTNYIVMLGPAGRSLASGPSGYVFTTNGQFVDWSLDIGDNATVKHGFKLGGGVLKNVERKNQLTR